MSDFLLSWLFVGFLIVGLVIALNGLVQLCVRKKTGPWKEGGASLLAGAIIAGVSIFLVWLSWMGVAESWLSFALFFIVAGLVLAFNGVVQLSVRKKTGPWKEGGATLLAGAIITGVSVFLVRLSWMGVAESWLSFALFFLLAGLVLAFNGVVHLSVRKKTGLWKEGLATLLAGAIVVGVWVFVEWLTGVLFTEIWSSGIMLGWCFLIAGLVLLFNGVVQLCVRKKTGPWKEGDASLLAGAIIVGVHWLSGVFI